MRYCLGFFIFMMSCTFMFSQEKDGNVARVQDSTRLQKARIKEKDRSDRQGNKPKIEDYKKISFSSDTTYIDTTLTIKKEYKFNYLRKDNFNLLSFANIGQTYNNLSYDRVEQNTIPLFGARARHFNYMEVSDIDYYKVPTPLTELFYKTAFQQGQVLDAFFTVNTSKNFNFSIAYKGLRSQGNYRNTLTSTGNFRFTSNYQAKNENYRVRLHLVFQDLLNQENGGLTDDGVSNFVSGAPEFDDRGVFTPQFENAENILEGRRYYFQQEFDIIKQIDSINPFNLSIYNTISGENRYYQYTQSASASNFFGESFNNSINDKVELDNFNANIGVRLVNDVIGNLDVQLNYNKINYGYDAAVFTESGAISNRIKENIFKFNSDYNKSIGKFDFSGSLDINLSENFSGNFTQAQIDYQFRGGLKFVASISNQSRLPNFNFLLYQSDYLNYNWDNYKEFKNERSQKIAFSFLADDIINAHVDVTNISNYTYFAQTSDAENGMIKPFQYKNSLQYLRVKLEKEFKLGNFYLDNTLLYQTVNNDQSVFNVPTFISRNTLYYSNRIFKNAMHLQTGIVFNWFSKYNMNGYDPLLAEFYVQNQQQLGGFPRLDFFINAKVRQTRIFLKAEHFNSAFTGYNYFSAPNVPYRDFTLRFGLVWNFFL
ncbi:MAG: putative porin [Bacteroidia bacterium]|nr:putative porin [Bacteroidia bacterium]